MELSSLWAGIAPLLVGSLTLSQPVANNSQPCPYDLHTSTRGISLGCGRDRGACARLFAKRSADIGIWNRLPAEMALDLGRRD